LKENTKSSLVLRGNKTSQIIFEALKDIHRVKNPHSRMLSRNNDIHPFEDESKMEFLCEKNDCSLFAFGSHNKKRPHNLVLGRTYDGRLLDMFELGVEKFKSVVETKAKAPKRIGSKPCIVFQGDEWEVEGPLKSLKNLLLDFFRGDEVDSVALPGLDHVMACTAVGGKVYLRHYHIAFKKSGGKIPRVQLESTGPSLDLVLRRSKLPSPDLWRAACKQPKQLRPKKVKNVTKNEMGDKVGRIHLGRQDLSSMKVKKVKALRETPAEKKRKLGEENNGT